MASFQNVRSTAVDGSTIAAGQPSAERLNRAIARVLGETGLCAWATVTPAGKAHINIGHFAHSEDLCLYLISHPSSLHSRNLVANRSMAVAVFVSPQEWIGPGRGMQLFGLCSEIGDAEVDTASRVYGERYSGYAAWKASLKPDDHALEYRFYRFVPDKVKILDETEFGDAVLVEAEIVRR